MTPEEDKAFDELSQRQLADLKRNMKATADAALERGATRFVEHYELALKAAFPEGAHGEAWEHWNKARITLEQQSNALKNEAWNSGVCPVCNSKDEPQPAAQWVGLTQEEINKIDTIPQEPEWIDVLIFARAIEAKLREKNGGGA